MIKASTTTTTTTTPEVAPEATVVKTDAATYDPKRGLGKHENIDVSKFDPAMAAEGKKIAEVKCTSCHKPTDEKLVGPGWKGITNRQTAGWIMNFITKHPSFKILALCFLMIIGISLVAEGLDFHIPKVYIYLPMAFAFIVDLIQMKTVKK